MYLIIGVLALLFGTFMLVLSVAMGLFHPWAALVVLGPIFLLVFIGFRRMLGRERLRQAIQLYKLEETNRFRRF